MQGMIFEKVCRVTAQRVIDVDNCNPLKLSRGAVLSRNLPKLQHGVDFLIAGNVLLRRQLRNHKRRLLANLDRRQAEQRSMRHVEAERTGSAANRFDSADWKAGLLGNFGKRVTAAQFKYLAPDVG